MADDPAADTTAATIAPTTDEPHKRNWWVWVSVGLAAVCVGLLIWALVTKSDLDSTKQDVANLEAEQAKAKESGSNFVTAAKKAFDDLSTQFGEQNEDLQQAEQDVTDAQAAADKAQADADQAKQQSKDTAAQAEAAAKAAESKAAVAAECAKAYTTAFGVLFADTESSGILARLDSLKSELATVTEDCRAALQA